MASTAKSSGDICVRRESGTEKAFDRHQAQRRRPAHWDG
jgi:hypothetical protein